MVIRWHTCVRKFLRAAATVLCGVLVEPAAATAADAACPPTAIVDGADGTQGMVASVVTLLRQHGVGSPGVACGGRVVRASLNRDLDARVHLLHIDDGFGRTSDRKVADASMAVSLIESWALGEDAYLLSPRTPAANGPGAAASAGIVKTVAPPVVGVAGPGAGAAWRLSAAAELSTDVNGRSLYGGAATGCARVGAICVGGRARFARGSEMTGFTNAELTRSAAELMAVAAWPLTGRHVGFTPLLGLGAGWGRAAASVTSVLPESFTVSREDVSLCAEVAARGGLRLGAHFAVLVEVGASVGMRVSGDRATQTEGLLSSAGLLPPASAGALRAAVGIEYAR